jgi:hypothetical protein
MVDLNPAADRRGDRPQIAGVRTNDQILAPQSTVDNASIDDIGGGGARS